MRSKNPAVRRKALLVFGRKSFPVLKKFLMEDSSEVIRHEAAFLLGASKNKKAPKILINAIVNDKSNLVRHEAIEALGDIGFKDKQVLSLLSALVRDKERFIVDTAKIALKTLEISK